jgi:3-oxoacyl-[acyl-carrier protein] reductase
MKQSLNVIVTGASRGLGLGIAQKLVSSGFRVIAIARHETAALTAAIAQSPDTLHFYPFDLAETGEMPALLKKLRHDFGPLYGLVNNAGLGTSGMLTQMPDSAIEKLLRLNTISPITLTKYAVRSMMLGNGGRIVNISSVVGFTGYSGLSAYSASKAALAGFTRSLAREIGPLGITVNTVAPGFIDTEMTDELTVQQREKIKRRSALGRMAEIEDVADAVDYFFSAKAKNITGTMLTVDAGNTA